MSVRNVEFHRRRQVKAGRERQRQEEKGKAIGEEVSAAGAVGVPLNTSINYQKEIEDFTEKDLV